MPAITVIRAGFLAAVVTAVGLGGNAQAAVAHASSVVANSQPAASAPLPRASSSSRCASLTNFVAVVGEGKVCESGGRRLMRLRNGRTLPVANPDAPTALLPVASAASMSSPAAPAAPVASAPLLPSQCVKAATSNQPHIELFYAHFLGQADNVAGAAADIAQQFRDVDGKYLNYDASHYFGTSAHLFVECDSSLNLVVHDVQLNTLQAATTFDTIVSDMQLAGYCQPDGATPSCTRVARPVHYWIWTDGNPTVYAGQSTVQDDDRSSGSNIINRTDAYSVNYGFTSANLGAQYFAHENGHAMGAVQLSAPRSTGGWHCTDGQDVMCYNDGATKGGQYTTTTCSSAPNGTKMFDCGWNDYFNPAPPAGSYLATHWNVGSPVNAWLLSQPGPTSTALTASATSAVSSQPITLDATVSTTGTLPGTVSGPVSFYDGSTLLATAALDSTSHASYTSTSLSMGSHSFTASFAGSSAYSPSSTASASPVSVANDGSQTAVRANPAPAIIGQPVTVTASVTAAAPGTGTPSGTVTFYDGTATIGTRALDGSGTASSTITWSAAGGRSLSASYSGDGNFNASTSQPATVSVLTQAPPRFSPQGVTDPQVAVTPDGSTQLVFWRAPDGLLAEAWYAGYWNGPVEFPQLGRLDSRPSVAVTKDGSTQVVFWQGPGGHLMEAWYSGSWNGPVDWTAQWGGTGTLASAPSVVTMPSGQQDVFWRGTNGHLWEAWYSGTWYGPVDFSNLGTLGSAPSAAITPDGSSQLVFWKGLDGNLTEAWYTGSWNGPVAWSVLGPIGSDPTVAVTPDGSTQTVFFRSTDGHLREAWYAGSWNGPVDWTASAFGGAGSPVGAPSATVTPDGSTQLVFWQGAGATLWEGWYAGGRWNGPVNWSAG